MSNFTKICSSTLTVTGRYTDSTMNVIDIFLQIFIPNMPQNDPILLTVSESNSYYSSCRLKQSIRTCGGE